MLSLYVLRRAVHKSTSLHWHFFLISFVLSCLFPLLIAHGQQKSDFSLGDFLNNIIVVRSQVAVLCNVEQALRYSEFYVRNRPFSFSSLHHQLKIIFRMKIVFFLETIPIPREQETTVLLSFTVNSYCIMAFDCSR